MKRFPWIIYLLIAFVIFVLAASPIISVMIAGLVANSHGCHIDEGSVHPCVINGHDYGETLYTLGVLGWFMLLTLPAGAFAFAIWLIVLLVHLAKWRRKRAAMSAA